jgi:hypothetical protein
MQPRYRFRRSNILLSLIVLSPAVLVACGGSSNGVGPITSEDAGPDASGISPNEDGGNPGEDGSSPADDGSTPGEDGSTPSEDGSASDDGGTPNGDAGQDGNGGSSDDGGGGDGGGGGAGADGGAAFTLSSPTSGTLAFGQVLCPAGNSAATPTSLAPAAAQSVTFQNTGSAPLDWNASVTTPYYTLSALSDGGAGASTQSGTLAAGASQALLVVPSAIPWPASTAANAYGDTLTITTDAPNDSPHAIALTETAQGAIVATSNVATGFGTVYLGTTGSLAPAFTLQNTGNGATNVTVTSTVTPASGAAPTFGLATTGGTAITNATPVALAASSTTSINGTYAPGASTSAANAATSSVSEAFTTDSSPLCAPLPSAVALSGTGTLAVAAYAPSSLNFQNVPCGTTATPQSIVFSNDGNVAYAITGMSLAAGSSSPFTAYIGSAGTTIGTVPAESGSTPGTLAVVIAPNAVPASVAAPGSTTYSDTLSVTYLAGVTSTTVTFPLTENPYGAVLAPAWQTAPGGTLPSSATDVFWFGDAQQNLQAPGHQAALGVANNGNATASMQLAFASGSSGPFNFPTSATSMPVGGADSYIAWSQPTTANAVGSTFSANGVFTVTGPNCGPASFTTTLGGQAAGDAQIYAQPTSVKLGAESCGSSPGATTLTLNNHSPFVYDWTATLASTGTIGGVPSFLLSATSGQIAAGGGVFGTAQSSFKVTPNPAALAASATPLSQPANYFNTSVTVTFTAVTAGATKQNAITIPLSYTPTGAVLAWPQGNYNVVVPKGKSANVRVINRGNAAGDAILTLASDANYSFAPTAGTSSITTSVNARAAAAEPVFNVPAGAVSTTASLTTDGKTTLCAPLPTTPATVEQ